MTFREFVSIVRPGYVWYDHCVILADVLQKVADGELKRVMIFEPPRHGKSEETSRLFSAYYLYRHPEQWVAITSYAAELAYTLSRSARDNYQRAGGTLKDTASAVKHWETEEGGGFWAAGVGGPATGKGFHLGIVDDPLKNSEESESEVIRSKQQDWWNSTWYTRAEPDAALIVIQTRWHEQDLSGWLLETEREEAEHWHIVNFPAICEPVDDRPEFPDTCTVEPEFRQPGDALCEERYPLARLMKIARKIGPYFWSALFQQRPRMREGDFFKEIWFEKRVKAVPVDAHRVRYWDRAGTDGGGAFTAGVLLAIDVHGRIYVEDVVRGQWSQHERDQWIKLTAEKDNKRYGGTVAQWQEQEPASAGVEAAVMFIRMLKGMEAYTEVASGSKETRARPWASYLEAGNVWLKEADWNAAYIAEHCAFPKGGLKDQVDASSGAFAKLVLLDAPEIHHN